MPSPILLDTEVLHSLDAGQAWFYAAHSGVELDLFLLHEGQRIGIEFKRQDAPRRTRSMRIAIEDLELDSLWAVYPGRRDYALDDKIQVRSLHGFGADSPS